jgi:hypothetical protein
MSMQLRIKPTRGVLAEQPHHQPTGINTQDVAVLPQTRMGVIFYPTKRCLHRPVMSRAGLLPHPVVADGKENRNRLGSREGGVIPPDRPLTVSATQILTSSRILTGHDGEKRLRVDLAVEA